MRTQMNQMEYYEAEGTRYMEEGRDDLARECLRKAILLGSERAVTFLQYLDMNVSDADFQDHELVQEPFDYDLQPLFHVSHAGSVLKKACRNVRNSVEAAADSVIWGLHIAVKGKPVSGGLSA